MFLAEGHHLFYVELLLVFLEALHLLEVASLNDLKVVVNIEEDKIHLDEEHMEEVHMNGVESLIVALEEVDNMIVAWLLAYLKVGVALG